MELASLRAFYQTVYYKSISIAAKELYLSQPAISMQIKSLEQELNTKLLERSNKGVKPTEAGNIVYEYAQKILELYEHMNKDLESLTNTQRNIFMLSCQSFGHYSLPCSLYEFKKKFKGVDFDIEYISTDNVIRNIEKGMCDIGFIEGEYANEDIECITLGASRMYFVANPEIVNSNILTKEEISRYSLFIIDKKCYLRQIIEDVFSSHAIDVHSFNIYMESSSFEAIKSSVLAGEGISVVPYLSIKKELYNKSLIILEVEDMVFKYHYSLIHSKKITDPLKLNFINFIKGYGKKSFC
ncbi:LysR family transcriptional regulator [Mahella sp.]|uniref:LysR family transcriptional regulator n=1 Tax=Mahella sp. TaxID=2798721 RepID=UPI0025BA51ED|nr:LysR family transcriptional regulator [Mahella sp.]MBZ4665535.1 transcriptional regulator, LysR family [Mahella sp.]